jgi:cyclopropane-fatty-acyl-phospholipid synthase
MSTSALRLRSPQEHAFATILAAVERGLVADSFVRMGVRRLLQARLDSLPTQSPDRAIEHFLDTLADHPIAIATDDANQQHYELPAEFFQTVLGRRLKYSCCYWSPEVVTLDQAEEQALRLTCQHAALDEGMEILELGCGWGSLSLWMAESFPSSRITAVSNSNSQREFIMQQASQRGIGNLRVITSDVNSLDLAEKFDRVVSVEMFEHVRNHPELMRWIHHWLRPGGQLMVHVFCHRASPYLFEPDGQQNWMARYFFTGGMMPSADLLPACSGPLKLAERWQWDGTHYAQTCRAWLDRQDASAAAVKQILARVYGPQHTNRWCNRWRLFFIACEELFNYHGGDEWFVSHYRFQR